MPILNFTTDIPAGRTVAEIQAILARAGAASVQIDYENGEPVAVTFLLLLGGRPVPFRLPSQWPGVHAILKKERHPSMRPKHRTEAHARAVAWRVVKDWVEAQLALIQSGQATLPQLFLPHAVRPDGRTIFEEVAANPRLLLAAGDEEAQE